MISRATVAKQTLAAGEPLPESAGLMGVLTLEDVLEFLLQEQIYDEMDRCEQKQMRLARKFVAKWREYVAVKKSLRSASQEANEQTPLL